MDPVEPRCCVVVGQKGETCGRKARYVVILLHDPAPDNREYICEEHSHVHPLFDSRFDPEKAVAIKVRDGKVTCGHSAP